MVKNYGSDVSREQFEIIRENLEKAKKAIKPKSRPLRYFLCGLVHMKTGCQWRNLPKDSPNWELVILLFYSLEKTERKRREPS